MMLNLAGPIIRPKSGAPQSALVLLHGYGSDGQDLIGLAPLFADLLPAPLIFSPNAPERCALSPMGFQWFPLGQELDFGRLEGIRGATETIHILLHDLFAETGLAPDRTFLGGFSQGAMLALHAGLTLDEPLAGIIAFSGGLPLDQAAWPVISAHPPILLVHGDQDEVVPPEMSLRTLEGLCARGLGAERHVSPGCPHAIAPDGIEVARRFVAAHAPAPRASM